MELIEIKQQTINNQLVNSVSARELHKVLESAERFSVWWDRMAGYGLCIGLDYTPYIFVHPQNKQESQDYALSIDAAKEICMIQRSEKGKEARQYFIACEKQLKQKFQLPDFTNPVIAARAWADEVEQKQAALAVIEEQKPLVEFANNVANTTASITIHGFAAILSADKINIGEMRLFSWLRENGYLTKKNVLTQYAKDGGWLKTVEKTRVCYKTNSIVPYAQTLVTGSG